MCDAGKMPGTQPSAGTEQAKPTLQCHLPPRCWSTYHKVFVRGYKTLHGNIYNVSIKHEVGMLSATAADLES